MILQSRTLFQKVSVRVAHICARREVSGLSIHITWQHASASHGLKGHNAFLWETPNLTLCKPDNPKTFDIKFREINFFGKTSAYAENDLNRPNGGAPHMYEV